MSAIPAVTAEERPGRAAYAHPVVNGFYGAVISALEDQPDGASAATAITAEFQRHHTGLTQSVAALTNDVRRLSADDACKAAMLTHAGRFAGRMAEESTRLSGQIHRHQAAEARMADLAVQLDAAHPSIAAQVREILEDVAVSAPVATGTVIVAQQADSRWTTGWFSSDTASEAQPLTPLPFVGWVLTAESHAAPAQGVESAFLHGGTWYTKGELAQRGLVLRRID